MVKQRTTKPSRRPPLLGAVPFAPACMHAIVLGLRPIKAKRNTLCASDLAMLRADSKLPALASKG